MVATVKVVPLLVGPSGLDAAAAMADVAPLRVAPYRARDAWLVQTTLPGTREAVLDKTARVTAERLRALGCPLVAETRCAHDPAAVADILGARPSAGIGLVLMVGASAIVDRRDVLPAALELAGGRVERFGVPVDPGNLLLLGRLGEAPVLGLPGSARSPRLQAADLVLRRLVAGLEIGAGDFAAMGVGGLLKEIPGRPEPRARASAPPGRRRVAAVVLAAGRSRRMRGPNKLLAAVDGVPMVRHAVAAALASRAEGVWVVLGHEAGRVREALAGLDVDFVENPDFAEGLSTSVARGLAALPGDRDGALVCLGDMPLVGAAHLDRLIAAFAPHAGRSICVPTWAGKRGNPVLWARHHFAEIRAVHGDVGARHLIGEHADEVVEVEMSDAAVLTDVDSPESLARLAAHGAG